MRVLFTVTSGPASGMTFEFTQTDTLLFGRASDAHVQIVGDKMVSRNHFSLLVSETGVRVRDLDSANGTYVARKGRYLRYGGKAALPPGAVAAPDSAAETALLDGDVISVGETKMSVTIEAPDDRTLVQSLAPDESERTMVQAVAPETGTAAILGGPVSPDTQVAPCAAKDGGGPSPATLKTVAATSQPKRVPNAPDFAGYELLDKIGEGGMGMVLRARRISDGRIVAIKTMHPPKGPGAVRMVDAFEREIRIQAGLKHSHIVEQLDIVRAGPVLGVVLEFVDGVDLARFVKDSGGKVPVAGAMPLMQGVLSGLACAHAAGIVHRELKPENIFLAKNNGKWVAKVADFGLAKSYEHSGKSLFEVSR